MALSGQPEFEARDVPTPTQMNDWMTTIKEKFNESGSDSVGPADLLWPLIAGGHLNISGYAISGVPTMMRLYNIAERRPWQTTTMIFNEVESRGGGAIVLPGNTTQDVGTDKDGKTGLRIGSNTIYQGCGISSVSGQLYIDKKHDIVVRDMTINGASTVQSSKNVTFINCRFPATATTHHIVGQDSENINFLSCVFEGAADKQLWLNRSGSFRIIGCKFDDWGEEAVLVESPKRLHDMVIKYNLFRHPSAYGGSDNYAVIIRAKALSSTPQFFTRPPLHTKIAHNMFLNKPGGIYLESLVAYTIRGNYIGDSTVSPYHIYHKEQTSSNFNDQKVQGPIIVANVLNGSTDIGVRLQGGRSAVVKGNVILATDECLAMTATGTPSLLSFLFKKRRAGNDHVVAGNVMYTSDATLPACAVWNLGTTPTRRTLGMNIVGNHMDGVSARGYRSYLGSPGSAGGEIGDRSNYGVWWVFVGNNSQGTTTSGGASEDMAHDTATKSIVLSTSDDTTPINAT
jgi:hypothetical protein